MYTTNVEILIRKQIINISATRTGAVYITRVVFIVESMQLKLLNGSAVTLSRWS